MKEVRLQKSLGEQISQYETQRHILSHLRKLFRIQTGIE